MTQYDAPAIEEQAAEPAAAPVTAPEITPEMQAVAAVNADKAAAAIRSQPMVKVRVPKVFGPQVVIINGARWNVPSNVFVEVPEQVAKILADAGRI